MFNNNKYLTVPMLSEYLKISKSYIYKKIHKNSIPYHKIGKSIRFNRDEIDQWVSNGCIISSKLPKLQRV